MTGATKAGVGLLLAGGLAVYGISIVLLVAFGGDLPGGGIQPDTSDIADAPARAANLLVAVDQVVGMLFTITVGLVVGVGFIFRDRDFRVGLTSPVQVVLVLFLMVGTICAVYFGYTARMNALAAAHFSWVEYVDINTFIGRQALAVVVTGGAALALFSLYLAEKHASAPVPATASPDTPPLAAAAPLAAPSAVPLPGPQTGPAAGSKRPARPRRAKATQT